MRRAALLVFAGALAAIAVSASRRPLPHRIFVPTGAGTTYRPRTLYISPDGADNWTVTAWRHYGGWTAEAVVTTGVNDCTPDCVDGHWSYGTMTVRLQRVVQCEGVSAYGTLVVLSASRTADLRPGNRLNLQRYCEDSFVLAP